MVRRSKRNIIREALLSGPKRWKELLDTTRIGKATLSDNLKKMIDNKEVIYDVDPDSRPAIGRYRITEKGREEYIKSLDKDIKHLKVCLTERLTLSDRVSVEVITVREIQEAVKMGKLDPSVLDLPFNEAAFELYKVRLEEKKREAMESTP